MKEGYPDVGHSGRERVNAALRDNSAEKSVRSSVRPSVSCAGHSAHEKFSLTSIWCLTDSDDRESAANVGYGYLPYKACSSQHKQPLNKVYILVVTFVQQNPVVNRSARVYVKIQT